MKTLTRPVAGLLRAFALLAVLIAAPSRLSAQTTLDPVGDSRSGAAPTGGSTTTFEVTLPSGHSGLRLLLVTTGGGGDADLYLQAGPGAGPESYLKRSVSSPGSDTLVLTESAAPGLYSIGIHRPDGQTGTLDYALHYEASWTTEVDWDAGDGALAIARSLPAQVAQDVYFRASVPAADSLYGALYAAVSADDGGTAHLFAASGAETVPGSDGSVPQSTRSGANALILHEGQFSASQPWVFRIRYTPGGIADPTPTLTCRVGEPVVHDLGSVSATEGANSGDLVTGPEGITFFRATVPAATPAWALWARTNTASGQPLTNLSTPLRTRRLKVPTTESYSDLRSAYGQMLVVPDYLNANGDTYFVSVAATPGTRLNLASYRQPTPDLASFTTPSEAVTFTNTSFLFKTYRVDVPVEQIGWDLTATSTLGNLQLSARRANIPNPFNNDAFAEAAPGVQDGISLAQPDLADGVWYVTVYTDGSPAAGSFRSGPPQLTDTTFIGTQTNDLPAKSGWRFYRVADLPSQLGNLGWDILLTTPVENRLLALRANGLPVRRQYRQSDSAAVYTSDRFDFSSSVGDLQRPGHQADVWYIGVYRPDDALGAFTLQTKLLTAETKAFESATAVADQPAGIWRYFRVDVPSGSPDLLGWDIRLDNITAGRPRIVVRRDQLPGAVATTGGWSWPIGGSSTYQPAAADAWPSGHQWASGPDLTGYAFDATGADRTDQFLLLPLGRPLQPGTYYIGVTNAPDSSASLGYTLRARGVWAPGTTGVTGPVVQTLAFSGAGNSATVSALSPRQAVHYRVTVPSGQPSWQLRLAPTTGDVVMAVRHLSLPSLASSEGGYGGGLENYSYLEAGVLMRKSGREHYTLLPTYQDPGSGLVSTIPAGDYYVTVMSQGAVDIGVSDRLGSGDAAFTLTSVGAAPVVDLGTISLGSALAQAGSLEAGQIGFYRFTVPSGIASLEARFTSRVGHPWLALATTPARLPLNNAYAYYSGTSSSSYGLDGSGPGAASLQALDYATLPNPAPGVYYVSVRASQFTGSSSNEFPDATFTLSVQGLEPATVAFDGGTASVASQPTNSWRYFKVVVPDAPGLLGWDLRLDNVTGGQHRLIVRRDLLPDGIQTTGGWTWPIDSSVTYTPHAADAWPSGHQWAADTDLTGYQTDADGTDRYGHFLVMPLGRPLQPGTYYIGVADAPGYPSAGEGYTLRSRGIWAPDVVSPSGIGSKTLAFSGSGNTAAVASLAPRETAYFRVTVPSGQPSWQLRLTATTGDLALAVRHLGLASLASSEGGYGGGHHYLETGVLMRKTGNEHYTLLPTYQDPGSGPVSTIPAGDYLVSVVSQGGSDVGLDNRLGSGPAAFTLTSVGAAPVIDLGSLALGGPALTRIADTLEGAQIAFYRFTAPAGLSTLEVELSDRVGTPWLTLANLPDQLPVNQNTGAAGLDASGMGGASTSTTELIAVPNPAAGAYYVSVRAGNSGSYTGYTDAAYSLRVEAPGPAITPVAFDGGTSTVSAQPADSWRYFQIEVPDTGSAPGLLGWDLRLENITGGHPRIVVRRDLLPATLASTGGWVWPLEGSTAYLPAAADAWPSGHQWVGENDLTGYPFDADATDRSGQFLLMPLGRPLQPGTYYVGVTRADSGTDDLGYTLVSRGVWAPGTSGASGPVAQTLAFSGAGNTATVASLAPRETAWFRVTVPAGQSSWQVRLGATTGDVVLAVRRLHLPSLSSYEGGYSGGAHYLETGVLMRKTGHEHYTLLPTYENNGSGPVTTLPAGDYYLSVTSQGGANVGLNNNRVGSGPAAFTLTSVGPAPVLDLGTVPAGGVSALTRSDALEAGRIAFYRFTVPAGLASLQIQLGDRVGNPVLALASVAGQLTSIAGSYYGTDFSGRGGSALFTTGFLTVHNPVPGTYTLAVCADRVDGDFFPDATFSLRLSENLPAALNVSSALNGNGLSHTVTASLGDGQRASYRIDVPATLDGQPVLAWTPRLTLSSGGVTWWINSGYPASAYSDDQIGKSGPVTAIVAPPLLTPGTWYVEVLGSGATTFTLTNSVATLQRPAWTMPALGQPVTTPGLASPAGSLFADTGVRTDGTPLPDPELGTVTDQGVDLAQSDYHYYAFTVPASNAGLVHVELIAINGNPDLFIRPQTLPSDDATATAPRHRLEGTGTEYAAFVPATSRTSLALEAGTWYVAVKASGGTNARYRLRLSHGNALADGKVQTLALNGGSFTGQLLAARDWRYYRVDIPAATPTSWQITYAQQQGDVDMLVRDTLPPGFDTYASSVDSAHDWRTDNKNQGPYAWYPDTGAHALPVATLRPGHTYYIGFRANTDASFSIISAASGAAAIPPALAFYGGQLTNVSLAAGAALTYRVDIPADAWRWKSSASATGGLDWFLEEGAPVDLARVGIVEAHRQHLSNIDWNMNQPLFENAWPWLPSRSFYLTVRNPSADTLVFSFAMNGASAATDDEDIDGLPDAWETARYGGAHYTAYYPNSDPDGDGIENLLEYALDLDPLVASTAGLPVVGSSGGNLTLTYRRVRADVIYTVQTTTDLATVPWTATGVTQGTPAGDGTTLASVARTGPRHFLRLHIAKAP